MTDKKNIKQSSCPKCGNIFTCSASGKCWCSEYSLSTEILEEIEKKYNGCLCNSCMDEYQELSDNLKK